MFRRCLIGGAAALTLTACTPDLDALMAWVAERESDAVASAAPCPIYADDLAWRGLPEDFLFIIERESNCDPAAVNPGSGALGLTQIMPSWLPVLCPLGIACTEPDLLDPEVNLDAAAYIFDTQGPEAWATQGG
jgi:soluble lytic murein transglycosylase-like protein